MTQRIDLKRIEDEVAPVLNQEQAELVDLKYAPQGGRMVLTFFLDKPGGITLDDCERLSDRIGSLLDGTDLVPGSYTLEVSSPGLDRVLKREADFLRFRGHLVRLRLKEAIAGQRRFQGVLAGMENSELLLECEDQVLRIGMDRIEEARLAPQIKI